MKIILGTILILLLCIITSVNVQSEEDKAVYVEFGEFDMQYNPEEIRTIEKDPVTICYSPLGRTGNLNLIVNFTEIISMSGIDISEYMDNLPEEFNYYKIYDSEAPLGEGIPISSIIIPSPIPYVELKIDTNLNGQINASASTSDGILDENEWIWNT